MRGVCLSYTVDCYNTPCADEALKRINKKRWPGKVGADYCSHYPHEPNKYTFSVQLEDECNTADMEYVAVRLIRLISKCRP